MADDHDNPSSSSPSSKPSNSNESVKAKEERLREKLKQRAVQSKNKRKASDASSVSVTVGITGTGTGTGTGTDGAPPSSETPQSDGQGKSKKARSRQRRRRRERRSEHRRRAPPPHHPGINMNNGNGNGAPMDNRSYYQQDHYGRFPRGPGPNPGSGPNPGPPGPHRDGYGGGYGGPSRGGYRGGGGRGRGGSPGRWERGGYDPRDHRQNHHGGQDRFGRGGYGHGPGPGPHRDGHGRRDYGRDNGTSGSGSGRDIYGRDTGAGSGSGRGRSLSRSFSRSRSRSSARSYSSGSAGGSYSSRSSKSSRSYSRDRERDRSFSRSRSRKRSRDRDRSSDDDSRRSRSNSNSRSRDRSPSRSARSKSGSRRRSTSDSPSRSKSKSKSNRERSRSASSPSRPSSPSQDPPRNQEQIQQDELTKDQRTIFVSQLVMKANESDIRRYFRKKLGYKVNDVILLKDKRSGRHKGCAYVELKRLEDVSKCLEATGKVPDFQRFPILLKASESDKHATGSAAGNGNLATGGQGIRGEAQKVYVGNIDQNVTQSQLYAIFSQFGQLDRVLLQVDIATGMSKGFAFLSYQDPKVSNLAIIAMSGQILGNKAIKTGWANQNSAANGSQEVQSSEFPQDAAERIEKTNVVFKQLNGSGLCQTSGILLVPGMASQILSLQALSPDATNAQIAIIAEEAVNLAQGLAPSATPSTTPLPMSLPKAEAENPKHVKGDLSKHILVRNMFDKDEETDENWADEIRMVFHEEGGKYGEISLVKVMKEESGGKIYASFESLEGAAACGEKFAGRWFDKRQLIVEFVDDATISSIQK